MWYSKVITMKRLFLTILLIFFSVQGIFTQEFETVNPTEIPESLEEALLASKRREMAEGIRRELKLEKPLIIEAFDSVPRHLFVPEHLEKLAYEYSYLPLGSGQVLPEPFLLARIIDYCDIQSYDRVLIIGESTPYAAALVSNLAEEVYVIEGEQEQYEKGSRLFAKLGYTNISIQRGQSIDLWKTSAPFDCIIIHGAVSGIPAGLLAQLGSMGRLICSLSDTKGFQILLLLQKNNGNISIVSKGESFFPILPNFGE